MGSGKGRLLGFLAVVIWLPLLLPSPAMADMGIPPGYLLTPHGAQDVLAAGIFVAVTSAVAVVVLRRVHRLNESAPVPERDDSAGASRVS